MAEPLILEPGGGETLEAAGVALTIKAAGADTGGAYSLVEAAVPPGGTGPLPHRHRDREEGFVVLDGRVEFRVGEGVLRAGPGAFLLVPRGTVHTFSNQGEAPARLLLVHSPAFDGYFRELAALVAAAPDPAAVAGLMTRWGMEVVQA